MSVIRAIAMFLCGFLTLELCKSQVVLPGACPDVKTMTDFNPSRYLGKWYEAEKYFVIFEIGGKCITAEYGQTDNGTITVVNKQVNKHSGDLSAIRGEVTQASRSNKAKLSVRFSNLPGVVGSYWVVDTDYDSYALVWSCSRFLQFHSLSSWILTRERNPPKSVLDKAYAAVDKNNISRLFYLKTDQQNCPDDK